MRVALGIAAVVLMVGLGLAARYFFVDGDGDENLVEIPEITTTTTDTGSDEGMMDGAPDAMDGLSDTLETAQIQVEDAATEILPEQLATVEETGELRFSLPLDCETYGEDCYILNYVNSGQESNPRDYTCGSLTYSTHRGTDFRLIDYVQMEQGVRVVAAAPGTVRLVQDGMPDVNYRLFGRDAVTDRGLGNRVMIDHGDGTTSTYGHLKRGSVVVAEGDVVLRGQMLGLVGMSGLTEFPHVHFEVNERGSYIDPFTGGLRHEGCNLDGGTMWRADVEQELRYLRTLIMRQGFADEALNRAAVEYALFNDTISANADALVFHVYLAGIQPGDAFIAEIIDPDGERFVKSGSGFESFQQARLLAIGKQDLIEPLKRGVYAATFRYFRSGTNDEILFLDAQVTVE